MEFARILAGQVMTPTGTVGVYFFAEREGKRIASLTDTWARKIAVWEEIPVVFRPLIPADRPLPYLIYSPPDAWGSRKVNARLTILSGQGITVLEDSAGRVEESGWLFGEMDYVEQGAVHLYSWMGLGGVRAGRPAAVQVEYNAVVEPLFTQAVQAVRRTWTGAGSAGLTEEQVELAGLAAVDYKFWTYARESLLPEEKVLALVCQPEIVVPRLLFFRRRLAPAYVCILTDRELIWISDDCSNSGRYGVIRRYIPLAKIEDWQWVPPAGELAGVWRLRLPGSIVNLYFLTPVQDSLLHLAVLLDKARGRENS